MFSPEPETSVREALDADAGRIAALARQLGYDVPVAHVERQLARRDAEQEQETILDPY